jgi:kynureninase
MYRDHFPQLTSPGVYLASHTLGPMPREAEAALSQYTQTWKARGVRAWAEGWWDLPRQVARDLAPLLGVSPEGISFHPHTSGAVAAVLSSLDFSSGRNKIVTTELEFPSIGYQLRAWEKYGAQVVVLPAPEGRFPWEAVENAVDNSTLLLAACHAYFKSSEWIDAARLAAIAHRAGARLLLDVYQTAGVMPLELEAEGVDYVVGGGVKWLLSGPGIGYLWVRPTYWDELPHLVGWAGHARPFAFELDWAPADGAVRYHTGTPNIPVLLVAQAGYRLLREVGLAKVWSHIRHLAGRFLEGAEELGFRVVGPRNPASRSGTVILDLPYGYAAELNAQGFVCDWRTGAGVRMGLHFFTLESEVAQALEALANIRDSKAWESHQPGAVT